MRSLVRIRYFALLLVIVVVAEGCAVSRNPVSGKKRAFGYSWAQECQIGQQADQQVQAQFGVYNDPQLNNYYQRVAERVLAQSHMRRPDTPEEFRTTPFTFRILDSEVINAMALPCGYVYVTRGLLSHLDNEAQLAVVLGHEIGHVAARHASQQALNQQLGQIGLIGGAVLGEAFGLPGGSILDLGSGVAQLLFLKYGRDAERESDQLGAEYAALNSYEIAPAARFFDTLDRVGEKAGVNIPSWQSSHPDPGEREQSMIEYHAEWESRTNLTRLGRDEYLDAINGIVVGPNPRNGFSENGRFYHPDLRFLLNVPRGWQVFNQAAQVAIVEPQQQAIMMLQFAQGQSAQQAASAFAQQQGVNVIGSRATTVNGKRAYVVEAELQAERGTFGAVNYFIEHGGKVYHLLGYAPAQTYGQYAQTMAASMQSFNDLTDQRILSVQPTRLRVQQASQTATFQSFITRDLPREWTAEDVAILNQVRLNEQIPAGARIKLTGQ